MKIKSTIYSTNHTLENFLIENFKLPSRSQTLKLIKSGQVKINNLPNLDRKYLVQEFDEIEIPDKIEYGFKILDTIIPKKIDFEIIYEDDDLLVINKKVGIPVHPGAGNYENTLLNGVVFYLGKGAKLINRLDKDTSGVVLVAKNVEAHTYYSNQFEQRNVSKNYYCVVPKDFKSLKVENSNLGNSFDIHGQISVTGFIERNRKDRKLMSMERIRMFNDRITKEELLDKLNHFKKKRERFCAMNLIFEGENDDFLCLKIQLLTGRKHQIRAFFKSVNFPILGDVNYGGQNYNRLMLHSYSTELTLKNNKVKTFKAELPQEFLEFL